MLILCMFLIYEQGMRKVITLLATSWWMRPLWVLSIGHIDPKCYYLYLHPALLYKYYIPIIALICSYFCSYVDAWCMSMDVHLCVNKYPLTQLKRILFCFILSIISVPKFKVSFSLLGPAAKSPCSPTERRVSRSTQSYSSFTITPFTTSKENLPVLNTRIICPGKHT